MAESEILDVFDDNMRLIGTASRREVHQKGYWHQSFHCWILSRRHGDALLFQRRGPDKKVYPNTLDITAAGHLLAGETVSQGVRELNEELGLNARIEDLTHLGVRCDVAVIGSVTNREFCHTFFLEDSRPLREYNLQSDEVAGLVMMRISDGLRLFGGEAHRITVTGVQVDADGIKRDIELQVGIGDIIPRLDRYYLKILIMAERYFAGSRYLGV